MACSSSVALPAAGEHGRVLWSGCGWEGAHAQPRPPLPAAAAATCAAAACAHRSPPETRDWQPASRANWQRRWELRRKAIGAGWPGFGPNARGEACNLCQAAGQATMRAGNARESPSAAAAREASSSHTMRSRWHVSPEPAATTRQTTGLPAHPPVHQQSTACTPLARAAACSPLSARLKFSQWLVPRASGASVAVLHSSSVRRQRTSPHQQQHHGGGHPEAGRRPVHLGQQRRAARDQVRRDAGPGGAPPPRAAARTRRLPPAPLWAVRLPTPPALLPAPTQAA